MSTKTDASGTTTYTYNLAGKLASVTTATDTWTYIYDAIGHLATTTHNGQEIDNLIDPTGLGNVVGQYDTGGLVANYTYGFGLTSQTSSGGSAYYAFDATGNTADLTGASGTRQSAAPSARRREWRRFWSTTPRS